MLVGVFSEGKEIGMEGQKQCTGCGEVLPLTEFYRDSRRKDGHYSECKACTAVRRKANRSRAREAEARYRERWREELRARGRVWAKANRAKRTESQRRWRAKRRQPEGATHMHGSGTFEPA